MIKTGTIYRGRIIRLRVDRLRRKNGSVGMREVVEHPGAAVVLPLFPNQDVMLVRQYRYALKRWTWEVPAGTLDPKESPLTCAKRELEEETGWKGKRFVKISQFFPAPGFCNELMTVYLATGLAKGRQHFDEDEDITIVRLPLKRALQWIRRGKVCDAKSIIALMLTSQMRRL